MLIEGTGLRKLRALVRFEWDSRKAASFEEAVSVFLGPLAKIFDDEDHPGIIGHSTHEHLLLVSLTQREGAIRIISARKATRHERKDYEEGVRA